jgi:DNA-binding response OmpR family regulator
MNEHQVRSRRRLVVMDDDTAFLQLMQELLEDAEGHEVLICREWDGAYDFVKEQSPDMVILDIRLGGEERGWTILNLLTLDPTTQPIPVIICSAAIQSLHNHQPWLDKLGVCALPKPFDLDVLLAMVNRVLGQDPSNTSLHRSCSRLLDPRMGTGRREVLEVRVDKMQINSSREVTGAMCERSGRRRLAAIVMRDRLARIEKLRVVHRVDLPPQTLASQPSDWGMIASATGWAGPDCDRRRTRWPRPDPARPGG